MILCVVMWVDVTQFSLSFYQLPSIKIETELTPCLTDKGEKETGPTDWSPYLMEFLTGPHETQQDQKEVHLIYH
jgi:hypothetical protein